MCVAVYIVRHKDKIVKIVIVKIHEIIFNGNIIDFALHGAMSKTCRCDVFLYDLNMLVGNQI